MKYVLPVGYSELLDYECIAYSLIWFYPHLIRSRKILLQIFQVIGLEAGFGRKMKYLLKTYIIYNES